MGRARRRDKGGSLRRLMEQSRGTVEAAGPHFVTWGVLVTVALSLSYANAIGAAAIDELWLWIGAVGLGWLLSVAIGARSSGSRAVRGPGGRIVASIWIGAGVALTLIGFVAAPTQAYTEAGALLGTMAAVLGAACFATGAVQDSSGFRFLAAGWWAGAVAMFVWPGLVALLVMAALMVVLQLAPGVWLILRSRRGTSVAGDRAAGETA